MNTTQKHAIALAAGIIVGVAGTSVYRAVAPAIVTPGPTPIPHVLTLIDVQAGAPIPSPAAFAPYVNVVLTNAGGSGAAAYRSVGIEPWLYTDLAHRIVVPNTFADSLLTAADDAHAANGATVAWAKPGHAATNLTNVFDPDLITEWNADDAHVQAAVGPIPVVFADSADDPFTDASPAPPQDPTTHMLTTQSAWTGQTGVMYSGVSIPIVFNAGTPKGPNLSPALPLLSNAHVVGVEAESCYDVWSSALKQNGKPWLAMESTELIAAAAHKRLVCHQNSMADGSTASALDARLYTYASFLLTYDVATSIYANKWATASKLPVQPETQFVPTAPAQTVTSAAALLDAQGVYRRQYAHCFLRGVDQGACWIAVNPDPKHTKSLVPPQPMTRHLVLAGSGIMDGATATIVTGVSGALGPLEATIELQ